MDGMGEGLSHTPMPLLACLLGPSQLSWRGGQAGALGDCAGRTGRISPAFRGHRGGLLAGLSREPPREEPGWAHGAPGLLCAVSVRAVRSEQVGECVSVRVPLWVW